MEIVRITWKETIPIRHEVLWPEKELSFCKVDGDEHAMHYGAIADEKLVCVASVYIGSDSARLRKFATLKEYQNRGIGSAVLRHILTDASKLQVRYFWLDARESAEGFYNRFGFEKNGGRFLKSEVQYFKMSKTL
jgi:predicted GNAT family N-acyltransferase